MAFPPSWSRISDTPGGVRSAGGRNQGGPRAKASGAQGPEEARVRPDLGSGGEGAWDPRQVPYRKGRWLGP